MLTCRRQGANTLTAVLMPWAFSHYARDTSTNLIKHFLQMTQFAFGILPSQNVCELS
jgi:hypothetical protein